MNAHDDCIFVAEWQAHWTRLTDQLEGVYSQAGTADDETDWEYWNSRSWFTEHETRFVLIYRPFLRQVIRPGHVDENYGNSRLRWRVWRQYRDDPFAFFFRPMFLKDHFTIARDYGASDLRTALVELSRRCADLHEWLTASL